MDFYHGMFSWLRREPVFAFVLFLSLILTPAGSGSFAMAAETGQSVKKAASVNGVVINVKEYQTELERIKRNTKYKPEKSDDTVLSGLKRKALEDLITRELLFQESVRQEIVISSDVIEKELSEVKKKFATPAAFASALERIRIDEAEVRRQIGRGLAIKELVNRSIAKDITASDDEIKKYYDAHLSDFTKPPMYHISHILVSIGKDRKAALDKIKSVQKRLTGGEKFVVLAAQLSDCNSKENGGNLGWFTAEQLVPEISKDIMSLKAGELSDIVEDRYGYHIIRMNERKEAYTQKLDEVKSKVSRLVKQEKGLVSLQRYVAGLRDHARVEILLSEND